MNEGMYVNLNACRVYVKSVYVNVTRASRCYCCISCITACSRHVKKFVRSHVAYLSGRVFDWVANIWIFKKNFSLLFVFGGAFSTVPPGVNIGLAPPGGSETKTPPRGEGLEKYNRKKNA